MSLLRARDVALAACLLACVAPGCAEDDEVAETSDDLTSLTARERVLTFEGYVYVHPDASEGEIMDAVLAQTRSAFGALQLQSVMVTTRELANVDPKKLVREPLTLVEADGSEWQTLRVRYLYEDQAVVPKTMSHRTALSMGLLHGDQAAQLERIYKECTKNTAEEREMGADVWYVFEPTLEKCQAAMTREQEAIDEARGKLSSPESQVVSEEVERLYIPITARLAPKPQAAARLYPEYDRLWAGGIEPGKLHIGLVNGMIDHAEPGKPHHIVDDSGYWEMLGEMEVILNEHPNMKLAATDPPTDLTSFTVNGKPVTGVGFSQFIDWELYDTSWPSGLSAADKLALRKLVAERLNRRWITFTEDVSVRIGSGAAKDVQIVINQYFGAEEDIEPYRRAIQSSDVFLYNGHSYIGAGPLDPANFDASDFPESYQILFIDSCVSFNYYNKDYFSYKERGSRDLDTITNALESFSDGAGAAQGHFVNALISGEQPSYKKLLSVASTTGTDYAWGKDALRVVDGEIDNRYDPEAKRIKVSRP
ncbi:MAG: hypothetical protein IPM79_00730 [Polyangiaceae bacterium]|nr:hypothetical protein [Polyangiaceae bacterium]MBK8936202.1 hypothetical protein [Polyangiaceae bacterium]